MKAEGFPPRLRIRRRREFLAVQRSGRKHHLSSFLVFVAPRKPPLADASPEVSDLDVGGPPTRLGITVTRKIGGAVVRNRIKRLVREVFRRQRRRFAGGLDMVWVAKRQAAAVAYEQVAADFETLLGRPGMAVATLSSGDAR